MFTTRTPLSCMYRTESRSMLAWPSAHSWLGGGEIISYHQNPGRRVTSYCDPCHERSVRVIAIQRNALKEWLHLVLRQLRKFLLQFPRLRRVQICSHID